MRTKRVLVKEIRIIEDQLIALSGKEYDGLLSFNERQEALWRLRVELIRHTMDLVDVVEQEAA
jgi:hypothetical protein